MTLLSLRISNCHISEKKSSDEPVLLYLFCHFNDTAWGSHKIHACVSKSCMIVNLKSSFNHDPRGGAAAATAW